MAIDSIIPDDAHPVRATARHGAPRHVAHHDFAPIDRPVLAVDKLTFLGETEIPFGSSFGGLQIGGLSAITHDASNDLYYALSDDRSSDARFYKLTIDLSDGRLSDGDVRFTGVQTLSDMSGERFPANTLDPEGLALRGHHLYLSSEGDASALISPFVDRFTLDGQLAAELPVDNKYTPTADQSTGIRNNLAFEALTVTPNGKQLYVGTEDALLQDGPNADLANGSPSRIIRYDLASGKPDAEYVYRTDPIQQAPDPSDSFATNGLVELLALDNAGHMLALERSFSTGVPGNDIRLYFLSTDGATDVSDLPALQGQTYEPASKTLLLDFNDLGITLDNIEGMAFGPDLPDGSKSLVLVSDDNFSSIQVTQFIALSLDLEQGKGCAGPHAYLWKD